MSESYRRVLEIVAENPASSVEGITELAVAEGHDEDNVRHLLARGVKFGDIIEAGGKHWVVRKGNFAFQEYERPH